MNTRTLIRRALLSGLVALWALSGCGSGDTARTTEEPVHLTRCPSCQSLEDYLKTSTIRMLQDSYHPGVDKSPPLLLLPGDPGRDGTSPPLPAIEQGASEAYSPTNIQESGVDEPDIVKTDGEYVYVLSGGLFLIYAATPPVEAREVSRTELGGQALAMFVTPDAAVVFTTPSWWGPVLLEGDVTDHAYYGLKITILDLTDRENPTLLRELSVQGGFVSARRIESLVHVVVSSYLSIPSLDYGLGLNENVERVRKAPLDSWIPQVLDVVHQGQGQVASTRPISACENFYLPGRRDVGPLLTVLSLDLQTPLAPPGEASIPSPAGSAYASSESIYVSHAVFSPPDYRARTAIHKFDISGNSAGAVYRASGTVDGWLLNQFSMGEKDGFLRVATTENSWGWGDAATPSASNSLFVLEEDGADLRVVGQVRNIAPDEQIYAARFLGDVGFMVTFEIIDPLFTFDLSDPTNPRLMGELEVPGYSAYIHPAGPDHLLTIGQDTETDGNVAWFRGMQISLYDISDLADPRLTQMQILGTQGTRSEALYDHKAFNYFPPKEVLAFPIHLYEGGASGRAYGRLTFVGFLVYGVDLLQGYSLMGRIDHDDLYTENPDCTYKTMRRTVIIGDSIYTISGAGMRIHALDDLTHAQASIPFPECGGEGVVIPLPGPAPFGESR